MKVGFHYARTTEIGHGSTATDALYASIMNCCHEQLGYSKRWTEARLRGELERRYPKGILGKLERRSWDLRGKRVLDIGAGQGGCLLELLVRGADAVGVEPFDEFVEVTRLRLDDHGFDPGRIVQAGGERLPFRDESFDYAISLQVLEHVVDPGPILEEIFRVLKPGGRAYIACANYLSFREQHYRLGWFPLLPKPLGVRYLRLKGRPAEFLRDYVYYTTYPQVIWLCRTTGFADLGYQTEWSRRRRRQSTAGGRNTLLRRLPVVGRLAVAGRDRLADLAFSTWYHANRAFRASIRLHLEKPHQRPLPQREA